MASAVQVGWAVLALVHAPPAVVFFRPALVARLYGVSGDGDVGVLLRHRGAQFLGIVALCVWAAVDTDVRRGASVVVAISMAGFLALYGRAGFPAGALRTIAVVDAVALVPLLAVTAAAWGLGAP